MRCKPLRWLWGLLILPFLTYFAVQHRQAHIEDDLRTRATQILRDKGLSWAGTTFVGRDGLLSGQATEDDEPSKAERAVRNLWGLRQLDNRVSLIDKQDTYVWNAKRRNGSLRLSGFVPNEAARRSILGVAKANFPGAKIEDSMRLARGVPARDAWLGGVSYSLKQLARMKNGRATMSGLEMSVSGEADDFAAYRTIKSALANNLPNGIVLKRDEVSPPAVSPYTWNATYSGRRLVLGGHVPSETAREAIFAGAKKQFPNVTIVDRMDTALGQPGQWAVAVRMALRELARLQKGKVQLSDKQMTFEGTAQTEQLAGDVRKAVGSGMPAGFNATRQVAFIEPAIKPVSPFVTRAAVERNRIVLSGYVPSEAARTALLMEARRRFANRQIVDEMAIAAGAAPTWQTCTLVGLGAVGRMGNGTMELSDRRLAIAGETRDEALANGLAGDVRSAAARSCETSVRIDYKAPAEPNLVWTADYGGDVVVLEGEVPDQETRSQLVKGAGDLFKSARVEDRMTVVGGRSTKWRRVALDGLEMLASLRTGRARLEGQRLTVRGEAGDSTTAGAIKDRVARDLPGGYSGRDIIEVRSDAMIWSEQEAKRKADLAAKRAREIAEQKRLAALAEARRRQEEVEALRQAQKRQREEERLKREETRRRQAEIAARLKTEQEARMRAEQEARKAAAALATAEAKRKATTLALAKQEQERVSCENKLRDVLKGGTILFRTAKADLRKASFVTLDKLAAAANACPDLNIEIAGHTDSDGDPQRNQSLSERRAKAVRDYLTDAGVKATRMATIGFGADRPIAPNDSAANKARNRRIEFSVKLR